MISDKQTKPQQEVERQNNGAKTIDFNTRPTKLVHFFSDHPFKTVEERKNYVLGIIDRSDEEKHLDTYDTSIKEYIDFNEKRVQWINDQISKMELNDGEDLYKNLKILIIIGSHLKLKPKIYSDSDYEDDSYYIHGYEDMNTALLIAHLFHYPCKIDYDNILITSSNHRNFIPTKIPEAKLSPKCSPSKKTNDDHNDSDVHPKEIPTKLYKSKISTIIDDVAYAQIGSKHIQFVPDINVKRDIKPFNRYFLQNLKTNENTELIVFFLDHSFPGFFQRHSYQYFVERLMEMTTKHITIFNQSCNSGSLIELIDISEQINEIFVSSQDSKQSIFQKLFSLAHDKTQSNDEKINLIIKEYHISPSEATKQKVINIINLLSNYKDTFDISPELFIQFKNKSTIFCSCSSTSECPTLPFREIIGPKDRYVNSQGGVFSSMFIRCLFSPNDDNDFSFSNFTKNLQDELLHMENELKDIMIKQNTIDHYSHKYDNIKGACVSIQETTKKYFKTNFTQHSLSVSSRDKIPNIKSITLPIQYWNIDTCDVDPLEYNIKVYDYISTQGHHKDYDYDDGEVNNDGEFRYGPQKGVFFDGKFMTDFAKCFDDIRKGQSDNEKFDLLLTVEEYSEVTNQKYSEFYSQAVIILDFNTLIPYRFLARPIKTNYQINFYNETNYFDICEQALRTIVEYWKDVEFDHHMI